MTQLALPDRPTFQGVTYDPEQDQERLSTLLKRVFALMKDGQWRTLAEIRDILDVPPDTAIDSRLRDLRKARNGAHFVTPRRVSAGVWAYQVIENPDAARIIAAANRT